ncbi:Ldh family oxidoreductase [Streptomyces sp. NPDC001941]|uniref:Ldh family oxidoreductase n=1 Tax=Streptomyces sp. NPDC001941 TaxID=3154659 RepID=UPI00332F2128
MSRTPLPREEPPPADPERVRLAITDIEELMAAACRAAHVPAPAARQVAAHFLEGELRGKPSHGLAKFAFESRFFPERQAEPEIVHQHGAFTVIDAHREIGPLSASFAAQVATDRARRLGVGVAGVINTQRYGILATFSEQIADHGLLAIVANTSRPEAVVHGASAPLLGVNPVSFAIPTTDGSMCADMSTTLAPMGVLWEARRSGTPLPADAFVDAHGDFTTDPAAAHAAMVFGEHRGFALSLLIQVLTGSLFGFPMGTQVDSTWSTGYVFLALDPAFAGQGGSYREANSQLATALCPQGAGMRLPGQRSAERARMARLRGHLDVDRALLGRLQARAAGDFTSD